MVQYLVNFVVPVNLSPFYPYPIEALKGEALPAIYPASMLILLTLGALVVWSARRTKIALFGFAFYFFTVILVSQFISVGLVIMADRYTYLPYIGLALALLLGIHHLIKDNQSRQYLAWGGLGAISIFLGLQTAKQADVWQDSETLWQYAAKFAPNDGYIMANLGNYYGNNGKIDQAAECFEKAIQNKTANANVYEGMGNVYGTRNQHEKAAEMFSEAIRLNPKKGNYYFNRGTAYINIDPAKGVEDFTTALAMVALDKRVAVLGNRGLCYMKLEKPALALADYDAIIEMGSAQENNYHDRGVAKYKLNDIPGAVKDFEAALRINPNYEPARNALQQLSNVK